MCSPHDLDKLERSLDPMEEFTNWVNLNRADYLSTYQRFQSQGVAIQDLRAALAWAYRAGYEAKR